MNYLSSISPVEQEHFIGTNGSNPFYVLCNDLNTYVCKYNTNTNLPAVSLFNEFLAASFLKLWGLKVPDFSFIDVKKEHISSNLNINTHYFDTICFGSLYNKYYKEMDGFFNQSSNRIISQIENIDDFLMIALFDIWLSNDDRTFGNPNLLLNTSDNMFFVPIDHVAIFHTGNLHRENYPLSLEDSIIYSNFSTKLFKSKKVTNISFLRSIEKNYYICVNKCLIDLDNILQNTPVSWLIDLADIKYQLEVKVFNKSWQKQSFNVFKEFMQLTFK